MRTPLAQARRVVRGVGPMDARIILVGEAPGRDEVWEGEPFVGMAGQLQQREAWTPLGIRREHVRIENVVEERPPGNKLEALHPRQVGWWQRHCHQRLQELLKRGTKGRVVVPTGNLALSTLMRDPLPVKPDGSWRLRKPEGIQWARRVTQWRGSLLEYEGARMIPAQHPASFLYGNLGYDAWKGDWRRIAWEVEHGCPPLPQGEDHVAESGRECANFLAWAEERTDTVAVDLETAGPQLLCAGLAFDPGYSLVIPLVDPTSGTHVKWGWFWLGRILASELVKVFHNGMFDTFLLRW